MRMAALFIVLMLPLVGCESIAELADYPPKANANQADQMDGVNEGDPIPEDKSDHPIDKAERTIRAVDEGAGAALNPATGGWWGVLAPALLGGLNLYQGVMRRADKRKQRRLTKKARRKLEDAGAINDGRDLEDDAEG